MHGGTKDDIRTAGQRNEVATLYCRCPLTGCADDGAEYETRPVVTQEQEQRGAARAGTALE